MSYSTQQTNFDNNFVGKAVSMDLSKAFHCITQDILIAKLAANGFEE